MDNLKLEQMIEKFEKSNQACSTLSDVVEVYNYLKELKMYRKIGTLKECIEAKEQKEMTGLYEGVYEELAAQGLEVNRKLISVLNGRYDKEKVYYEFQQIVGMILEDTNAELMIGEFNIRKCFEEFMEKCGLAEIFRNVEE